MAETARLITTIIPERYRIDLEVDLAKFAFCGREEITFELAQAGRELVFHAVGLRIEEVELDDHLPATVELEAAAQVVRFGFAEMVAGGRHVLKFRYSGVIQDSLHGFYRSRYMDGGREAWIGITQFEPASAREALVCVDEPAAKAVFELSLVVPAALRVLSNTAVAAEEQTGEGRRRVRFAPTPKMSSYLLAWAVGAFEQIEAKTAGGVMVRALAVPGLSGQLEFALQTAVRTLDFYNAYFGLPYPLPKLDMLAAPDFAAGAMENWGLVIYRDTALLLDPAKTSLAQKQRVAEVITHELAHQWFGNLVTMAWWDDLWLNEGFASWMEVFAEDKLFPEWRLWERFLTMDYAAALDANALASAPPLQVDISDPRELDTAFDPSVVYAKGASVIRMLESYVGAEAFRAGLQLYLGRHQYGNATTHDLWTALGEASGQPVSDVMAAWTAQAGYPLLEYGAGGAVRQRRFYSAPREAKAAAGDAAGPVWDVPFQALTPDGATKPELVRMAAADLRGNLPTGDGWWKPNPGQTALYRSLYTPAMLNALRDPLMHGELEAADRFGVVSDVVATTAAGLTGTKVALELMENLRDEPHYVVWSALAGGLGGILGIVENDAIRTQLEGFGQWMAVPNAKRLGWRPAPDEDAFTQLMRPLVLLQAVRFGDEAVVREARARFDAYVDGGVIDADLRPVALAAAARYGGVREFEAMTARYRREESPQVRISLLGALGGFREPELIKRYLEWSITPDVRSQDFYVVMGTSMRNRAARDVSWQFLQEHWDLMAARYGAGGHMLERFPLQVAAGFATAAKARELEHFFTRHAHPATRRATEQAVEIITLKADWFARDQNEIEAFLAGHERRLRLRQNA